MARRQARRTSVPAISALLMLLLALAIVPPTPARAAPNLATASASQRTSAFSLDFNSLPSAQGWTYFQSDGIPETSIFSVTGTSLIQDTIGTGEHNPNYAMFGVIDGTKPFELTVRARILAYEGTAPFGFFFDVRTASPNQEYAIGLTPSGLQDPLGNGAAVDTTVFHTYVLRATPGGPYKLYVDGQFAFGGPFSATGGALNAVQFGDDAGLGPTNARAEVTELEFSQRHKVAVLLQGINTSLSCDGNGHCSPGDQTALSVQGLLGIQNTLADTNGVYGFDVSDVIWYSYNGGTVDSSGYHPNNYACGVTKQPYGTDITHLRDLIERLGASRPGTDFYLVGHSQGGLIAFQELGYLSFLPQDTQVNAVFTLDSPLGGAPRDDVKWARRFTCWGNPAAAEQISIYRTVQTASDHRNAQGDLAQPACAFGFGIGAPKCLDASGTPFATNDAMIQSAGPVKVFTFGNMNDPVYRPSLCGLPIGSNIPNTSSQIVRTADSGPAGLATLHFFPPASPAIAHQRACVSDNHGVIVLDEAAAIEAAIGPQS